MNDDLYQDDDRDRIAFIEYYPTFVLTSEWSYDGRLWFYHVQVIS